METQTSTTPNPSISSSTSANPTAGQSQVKEEVEQQSTTQSTNAAQTDVTSTSSGTHPETGQTPEDPAMAGRKRSEADRASRNKIEQENKNFREFFSSLDEEFKENPELFDKVKGKYEKATGKNLGSYEQIYGNKPSRSSVSKSDSNLVPLDPGQIQQIADQVVSSRLERQEALAQFVRDVPEMAITPEDSEESKEEKTRKFGRVLKQLNFDSNGNSALVDYYRQDYGFSLGQVLTHLYKTDPENLPKLQEQAKQDGLVAGQQKHLRSGVGVVGSISGSNGGNGGANLDISKLSEGQRQVYEDLSSKDPEHAQKYYERAVGGGPIRRKI